MKYKITEIFQPNKPWLTLTFNSVDFGNLSLGDSNSDRDSETLGPLPVHLPWDGSSNSSYPAYDSQPYRSQLAVYPRPDMAANNGVMDYKSSASNLEVPPPNYSSLDRSTDVEGMTTLIVLSTI